MQTGQETAEKRTEGQALGQVTDNPVCVFLMDHDRLKANEEFRLLFADPLQEHFFKV